MIERFVDSHKSLPSQTEGVQNARKSAGWHNKYRPPKKVKSNPSRANSFERDALAEGSMQIRGETQSTHWIYDFFAANGGSLRSSSPSFEAPIASLSSEKR